MRVPPPGKGLRQTRPLWSCTQGPAGVDTPAERQHRPVRTAQDPGQLLQPTPKPTLRSVPSVPLGGRAQGGLRATGPVRLTTSSSSRDTWNTAQEPKHGPECGPRGPSETGSPISALHVSRDLIHDNSQNRRSADFSAKPQRAGVLGSVGLGEAQLLQQESGASRAGLLGFVCR